MCEVCSQSVYVGKLNKPVKLSRRIILTLKELSIGRLMNLSHTNIVHFVTIYATAYGCLIIHS